MDLLEPVIKPYAWGSRHAIAELQERAAPSKGPEAELWMGAHPGGPSGVRCDGIRTTLDQVLSADPTGTLGRDNVERFGPRLPFLLKVIAAEKPLSIQVHPDRQQAKAGFRAENERGLAPDDRTRNYVDDWPKPELVYTLTPFEALAGFRTSRDAADLLDELHLEELRPLTETLRTGDGTAARTATLRRILTWPRPDRAAFLERVVTACNHVAAAGGRYAAACDVATRIAEDHPDDLGIVASLLLCHVQLPPGEALFMPAGGVHAYVKGVGVEVLANSDNVLRAGLTGKHVDVDELLRISAPDVPVPVLSPVKAGEGISVYDAPVPEFGLGVVTLAGRRTAVPMKGPRILLCLEGAATVHGTSGDQLALTRGASCFVAASEGPVTVDGNALLVVANTE
ncbi:mannose-6-phosphate isomerase, class I [Micromonospora sp. KLBMP9576]|uniref:mannose-6-phosphate isomerase, class I n=1 Tax=Micromonospora sp. KLBMP9576 TaxID=3424769 RepID=UPI003D8FCC5E